MERIIMRNRVMDRTLALRSAVDQTLADRGPLMESLECRRMLAAVFLSDLDPTSAVSPYGGLQQDLSTDENPLTINGEVFAKGLGTHSRSELVYNLGGEYQQFTASVGIDDEVGDGANDGSAVFEVYGDDVLLASSSRLTGADDAEPMIVHIA